MKKITNLAFIVAAAASRLAYAQDVPPEVQITPEGPELAPEGGNLIDLQNIVTTAAKGVTTVQEAPAIVTIVTADDIKMWGYRDLEHVLADIPGWNFYPLTGETGPTMTVRGQTQSMLYLHDGVSMFNPEFNIYSETHAMPLESVKRIEVVTGPGGVLWGANSFMGIVNVITKDADDVPGGVEASAGYGDGRGDASDVRAYAMVGQTLLDGRLKLFMHGAYNNYQGQIVEARQLIIHSPAPSPNGSAWYGTDVTSDQRRSFVWTVDGKISMGPLSLYWEYEDGEEHLPTTFPLGIVQQGSCPANIPWCPNMNTDPHGTGHDTRLAAFDRFAALEYRDRFASGRVGLNVKGYLFQGDLDMRGFTFLPPSTTLKGGAGFNVDSTGLRSGVTLDTDVALPYSNRLLIGGEAFREWDTGSTATFFAPNPAFADGFPNVPPALFFLCPHNASMGVQSYQAGCPVGFVFPASREVGAAYISDQWRPIPTLTLDAGARIQAGFGERAYDAVPLFSGTAVWNFIPGWHLKANFSQGFRAPEFSNTNPNGAAVNLGGNPNLKNETSNAAQGEINARILRNIRKIRELTLRADYSYSRIENLIVIGNGRYQNTGTRGINSAEFLSRLYLRGDHTLQLGYTFLQITDDSFGLGRNTPNHWFTLDANFNILRDKLDFVTTLWFAGAAEDPNRIPGGSPFQYNSGRCILGVAPSPMTCGADARVSDVALDRIPAIAFWTLGMRWRNVVDKVDFSAFVYNALDQVWFYADALYARSPQLELQPYPAPGRSFFAKATYHF